MDSGGRAGTTFDCQSYRHSPLISRNMDNHSCDGGQWSRLEMYNAYRRASLSRGRVDICDAEHHVRSSTLRKRTQCRAVFRLCHDL